VDLKLFYSFWLFLFSFSFWATVRFKLKSNCIGTVILSKHPWLTWYTVHILLEMWYRYPPMVYMLRLSHPLGGMRLIPTHGLHTTPVLHTHFSPFRGKIWVYTEVSPHTQFSPFALIDYTRAIIPIRGRPYGDFCRAFDAEEGKSPLYVILFEILANDCSLTPMFYF
jgi:hypothetical protein